MRTIVYMAIDFLFYLYKNFFASLRGKKFRNYQILKCEAKTMDSSYKKIPIIIVRILVLYKFILFFVLVRVVRGKKFMQNYTRFAET